MQRRRKKVVTYWQKSAKFRLPRTLPSAGSSVFRREEIEGEQGSAPCQIRFGRGASTTSSYSSSSSSASSSEEGGDVVPAEGSIESCSYDFPLGEKTPPSEAKACYLWCQGGGLSEANAHASLLHFRTPKMAP